MTPRPMNLGCMGTRVQVYVCIESLTHEGDCLGEFSSVQLCHCPHRRICNRMREREREGGRGSREGGGETKRGDSLP